MPRPIRWHRIALAGAALLLAVILALAHLRYWYQPRARPAAPDPASPVAALLASERFPAVLWLPYPHQNLAAVAPAEAQRDFLTAFSRLAGLPPPVLPAFGSFSVVPASELVMASDERGERFVVMAQVYPLLAAFSRLAGRLGDNPWLAGGTVTIRDRPATVGWRGNVWIVQDAASAPPAFPSTPPRSTPPSAGGDEQPSLAVLALRHPPEPFPAGRYTLRWTEGGLELRSQQAVAADLWWTASSLIEPDLVLLVLAGPAARGGRARALAFFAQDAGSRSLPRAAVFNQQLPAGTSGERWSVPGEALVRLAGELERATVAGWELEALGPASLARARELAPDVAPMAGVGELRGTAPPVTWALWSDLASNHAEVDRLARMLAENPLAPPDEAARWRDAARVLAPVARRFRGLVIVVAEEPHALRLRLEGRAAPVD